MSQELTLENNKTTSTESTLDDSVLGSRLVELGQVKGSFSLLPTDKSIRDEVIKKIGSQWRKGGTKDIIRGLSPDEEREYLPNIIGINPSSNEWNGAVKDYWANFTLEIPASENIILEVGFEKVSGKITPINIDNYIKYNFCLEHSRVATSEEQLENISTFSFYIKDRNKVKKENEIKHLITKKAELFYVKLTSSTTKESASKIEELIRVLSIEAKEDYVDVFKLSTIEKEVKLKEYRDKDPQKFINLCEDPTLSDQAVISKGLATGLISIEGESYFMGELRIGSTRKEAIGWFSNPANSEQKMKFLASVSAALK